MKNSAQSLVEYAVFACFLVAALVGMQMYLKRGIQGKIKASAEQVGPISYSPGATISNITINREINDQIDSYGLELLGNDASGCEVSYGNYSIYNSSSNTLQQTNRLENVLSVDQEPVR
ncbi:MAG: hypothetical protein NT060_04610 [Candidatus Omnitrophica bacterium]|nr:hypothetical protein [Candidatus Omnitrophota bacterium]